MGVVTKTVGETLIDILEANGVDVVFGIPGVHTVELYRGSRRPISAMSHRATSRGPVSWPMATRASPENRGSRF